MSYYTVEDVMQ